MPSQHWFRSVSRGMSRAVVPRPVGESQSRQKTASSRQRFSVGIYLHICQQTLFSCPIPDDGGAGTQMCACVCVCVIVQVCKCVFVVCTAAILVKRRGFLFSVPTMNVGELLTNSLSPGTSSLREIASNTSQNIRFGNLPSMRWRQQLATTTYVLMPWVVGVVPPTTSWT